MYFLAIFSSVTLYTQHIMKLSFFEMLINLTELIHVIEYHDILDIHANNYCIKPAICTR